MRFSMDCVRWSDFSIAFLGARAYGDNRAVVCAEQRAVSVGAREPVPMERSGLLSAQNKELSLWGTKRPVC